MRYFCESDKLTTDFSKGCNVSHDSDKASIPAIVLLKVSSIFLATLVMRAIDFSLSASERDPSVPKSANLFNVCDTSASESPTSF